MDDEAKTTAAQAITVASGCFIGCLVLVALGALAMWLVLG